MRATVSDELGTFRLYFIKYMGSKTGYTASCVGNMSIRTPSNVHERPEQHTIENSTLLGANVIESASLH